MDFCPRYPCGSFHYGQTTQIHQHAQVVQSLQVVATAWYVRREQKSAIWQTGLLHGLSQHVLPASQADPNDVSIL